MSKQTAVEFLELQLIKNSIITNNDLKQAKQMEKEQLLDMGYQFAVFGEDNPEQYYNETFGGNNE